MRQLGLVVGLVGLLFASGCSQAVKATAVIDQQVDWSSYDQIMVSSFNGSVAVEHAPGTTASITGEKWSRSWSLEDAEQRMQQIAIVAKAKEGAPNTLAIEVQAPKDVRRNSGAKLNIAVPSHCFVHVRTSNGGVRVENMASTDIDTSNGSVTVREVAGNVKVESSNGSLTLEHIQGPIDSHTSNGRITLRDVHGPIIARTSNGRITAEQVQTQGDVVLRSSNGSIVASLPATLSAKVEARTSNGSVNVDLADMRVAEQSISKRSYQAVLNGGEHQLKANTSNGSIKLKFQ